MNGEWNTSLAPTPRAANTAANAAVASDALRQSSGSGVIISRDGYVLYDGLPWYGVKISDDTLQAVLTEVL